MKLSLRVFDIHTDVKRWRGAIAAAFFVSAICLYGGLTAYARGSSGGLVLFSLLISGIYLGIVIFQLEHKPKTTSEAVKGDYWLFVKDPSRVGVYGPYPKAEAKSQVVEFNESYPFNSEAAYVRAKSREEAQTLAKDLRKP